MSLKLTQILFLTILCSFAIFALASKSTDISDTTFKLKELQVSYKYYVKGKEMKVFQTNLMDNFQITMKVNPKSNKLTFTFPGFNSNEKFQKNIFNQQILKSQKLLASEKHCSFPALYSVNTSNNTFTMELSLDFTKYKDMKFDVNKDTQLAMSKTLKVKFFEPKRENCSLYLDFTFAKDKLNPKDYDAFKKFFTDRSKK